MKRGSRSMKVVLIALFGALVLAAAAQAGTAQTTRIHVDLAGRTPATGALAAQPGPTRIGGYAAGRAHATGALPDQGKTAASWWHSSRTDLAASHMSAGRASEADWPDSWSEWELRRR